MIILVQDRDDNLHIADYTPASGRKFCICGHVYFKKDIVNTLALDNTIPGICRICSEHYQAMYEDDLNFDPRMARSSLNKNMENLYFDICAGRFFIKLLNKNVGIGYKYYDLTTKRWEKLTKLRRKITRK